MKDNVLFVDDDQGVLDAYRRVFRQKPFGVYLADSAERALKILREVKVALVVSDYRMMGQSGLELMADIQRDFPDIARIMISGEAQKDVVLDAFNYCGVKRFFEKPCCEAELNEAILDILEGRAEKRNKVSAERGLALRELERASPGISAVERDEYGVIVVRS